MTSISHWPSHIRETGLAHSPMAEQPHMVSDARVQTAVS